MRKILLLGVLALLYSCSPKVVATSTSTADSVKVEVHDRLVHDTVYFELPCIEETRTTGDTVSHLENDFAISDAAVSSGQLLHSLMTKPQQIQAVVAVPVHDTIIKELHVASEVQTVEVERELTWWQKFWMAAGRIAIGVIVLALLQFILSKLGVFK